MAVNIQNLFDQNNWKYWWKYTINSYCKLFKIKRCRSETFVVAWIWGCPTSCTQYKSRRPRSKQKNGIKNSESRLKPFLHPSSIAGIRRTRSRYINKCCYNGPVRLGLKAFCKTVFSLIVRFCKSIFLKKMNCKRIYFISSVLPGCRMLDVFMREPY